MKKELLGRDRAKMSGRGLAPLLPPPTSPLLLRPCGGGLCVFGGGSRGAQAPSNPTAASMSVLE
jgi:hypothetical protein